MKEKILLELFRSWNLGCAHCKEAICSILSDIQPLRYINITNEGLLSMSIYIMGLWFHFLSSSKIGYSELTISIPSWIFRYKSSWGSTDGQTSRWPFLSLMYISEDER